MVRTNKTKEEFIKDIETRLAKRQELKDFYADVYLPLVKKFNGKVLNARFFKALKSAMTNELMSIHFEKGYDEGEIYLYKMNYTKYESIWVKLITNDDNRIDYDATLNNEMQKKWLDSFDKDNFGFMDAIKNYDLYIEQTEKLKKEIEKFNDIPFIFRRNVDEYFQIFKQ